MLKEEDLEKIKKITEEFFEKMGFDLQMEISLDEKKETVFLNLKTEEKKSETNNLPSDASILIGEKGQVLFEIQHLLKAILKKKIISRRGEKARLTEENFYIDLDINDYKKKKNQYLREWARALAQEVVLTKREKELPPMPPAERRIIHLELAEKPDITTQSIGKEPHRRIIIRPYP